MDDVIKPLEEITGKITSKRFEKTHGITESFIENEEKKDEDDDEDILSTEEEESESCRIRFLYNNDITNLLFQMIDNKYIPDINFSHGSIQSLTFKVGGAKCTIQESIDNSCPDDTFHRINEAEKEKYNKIDTTFYDWLINNDHISHFSDKTMEILQTYQLRAIGGYFGEYKGQYFNTIDFNKSYPTCLMCIDKFPVYNEFDVFMQYDDHPLEDYTWYIIECHDITNEAALLFGDVYSRNIGYVLKQIKGIQYKILSYWRPSKLIDSNSKQHITDHFNNDFDQGHLKFIANKNIGILEKKYNKLHASKIFINYNEALHFQLKYGGKIYPINNFKQSEIYEFDNIDDVYTTSFKKIKEGKTLYVLCHSVQKNMYEGFLPIKDMIYAIQKLKLWQLYNALKNIGISAAGVKTDCMLITESEKQLLQKSSDANISITFDKKIGGIKFESNKFPINKKITMYENKLIEIKNPSVNIIELKNEYDTQEMKEILQTHDKTFIGADLPGSGKTTAVKNCGYTILFITPFNMLALDLKKAGYGAGTLHKLLAIDITGEHHKWNRPINTDSFEAICFDEILLHDIVQLGRIYRYMNNHTDKKYFSTGDLNQLEPIGNHILNNINENDVEKYIENAINIMFPNRIVLHENKRLKSEEDKKRLRELFNDIFDYSQDLESILIKHRIINQKSIKSYEELETIKHISIIDQRL